MILRSKGAFVDGHTHTPDCLRSSFHSHRTMRRDSRSRNPGVVRRFGSAPSMLYLTCSSSNLSEMACGACLTIDVIQTDVNSGTESFSSMMSTAIEVSVRRMSRPRRGCGGGGCSVDGSEVHREENTPIVAWLEYGTASAHEMQTTRTRDWKRNNDSE